MFYLVPVFNKLQRFLVLTSLLFISAGHVKAQDGKSLHSSAATNSVIGSSRNPEGLAGPVRRVRTEVANLLLKEGKLVESPRVLLETTTYDRVGNKVDNLLYAVSNTPLIGKEVYKYDDKGNIVEMTVRDDGGSVVSQEVYAYEFDALGNWTKMTTSVAVIENGNTIFEPTEVTHRAITYYRTDAVARVIAPPPPVPTKTPETMPAETPSTVNEAGEMKAGPQVAGAGVAEKAQPEAGQQMSSAPPVTLAKEEASAPPAPEVSKPVESGGDAEAKKAEETKKIEGGGDQNAQELSVAERPVAEQPVAEQPAPKQPVITISGGLLNAKALHLPRPEYPDIAKRSGQQGTVSVEVLIDVTGKVISAKAVSGPVQFRRVAELAARQAKFSPAMLSGQPIRITGVMVYNFFTK